MLIGNGGGSGQDYVLVMGRLIEALCDKDDVGFLGLGDEISFKFMRFLKSAFGGEG
ncbi:hypothetical protein LFL97_09780 [Burkholderia sp. JSH-S8]|nr:hypothetical protein LFL97_09780 [Burkholderia sp. JSH-S8]